MPKRVQDVAPPQDSGERRVNVTVNASGKKSIRDIPIPERRGRENFARADNTEREDIVLTDKERMRLQQGEESSTSSSMMFYIKILIGVLIVAGLAGVAVFSGIFKQSAVVTVEPKVKTVTLDGSFQAHKEPKDGELGFTVMTLSAEDTQTVPATGEKQVETRASGRIVIFNNQSSASQRLIKNTRFETPQGLIYRIQDSVVVPGQKKVNGETVPGSLEVTVYADSPGTNYNIGLTDFTIPGFKGDPRFQTFFARSKTPMTGGATGTIKTGAPSDIARARESLRAALKDKALSDAKGQVPAGSVLYPAGATVVYESLSAPEDSAVKERATVYAPLFDSAALSAFLAGQTIAGFDGALVLAQNLPDLTFIPSQPDLNVSTADDVSFSLSGSVTFVWQFDQDKLKSDLAGQDKGRVETVLAGFPAISKASVSVKPFWKGSLPSDAANISVSIQGEATTSETATP